MQKPKGTMDFYDKEGYDYIYLCNYISNFMLLYNFNYIKVPTFEHSEVFKRGVGETTDIVSKETYDFKDKGSRDMTLRPELTAGVARSVIENKLYVNPINKFYYIGSAFRYERPQAGRYREFTQFGVEMYGSNNISSDIEVLSVCYRLLESLKIENLKVKINSIGNIESRNNYNKVVKEYFKDKLDSLCETCKERYEKNVLRILDCKEDCETEILKNAPKPIDYLTQEDKDNFKNIKNVLDNMGINYEVDSSLVRGLDYYTGLVFEFVYDSKELGPASVICGGGRYNNLITSLGGPEYPGVGFALGIERLMKILEVENINLPKNNIELYVMNLETNEYSLNLIDELRCAGFKVDSDYLNKNMKSQFKTIEKLKPRYILICGSEEEEGGFITIKDNDTKESVQVNRNEIIDYLDINL